MHPCSMRAPMALATFASTIRWGAGCDSRRAFARLASRSAQLSAPSGVINRSTSGNRPVTPAQATQVATVPSSRRANMILGTNVLSPRPSWSRFSFQEKAASSLALLACGGTGLLRKAQFTLMANAL